MSTYLTLSEFGMSDLGRHRPHRHHRHGGGGGGGWWGGGYPYPFLYQEPIIIERVETEEERKKRLEREAKIKAEQAAISMSGYGEFLTEEALRHGTVHLSDFACHGRSDTLNTAMQNMADFLTTQALQSGTVRFGMSGLGVDPDAAAAKAAEAIASRTARVTIKNPDGTPYIGPVVVVRLSDIEVQPIIITTINSVNGTVEYLIPSDGVGPYYFNVQADASQKGNSVPANPGSSESMTLESISGGGFPVLPVLGAALIGFLALKG